MATSPKIDWITLNPVAAYGAFAGGELRLPLESESALRGGWAATKAAKVGNDPNVDLTAFLSTYPVIAAGGLTGGAFARKFSNGSRKFHDVSNVQGGGLTTGPLAWTLYEAAPLLPGAGWVTQNGAYAFKEFCQFKGGVYGLDVKGNKVWKDQTGTWTDKSAGLSSEVTELFPYEHNGTANRLIAGQVTGLARGTTDGASWSDWTANAQHFAVTPKSGGLETLWYSSGRTVTNTASSANYVIGLSGTSVNRMIWFGTRLLVAKPEGIWSLNPITREMPQKIFAAEEATTTNGRVMLIHSNELWVNYGDKLYHYSEGGSFLPAPLGEFEGVGARPFYGGTTVGAWSSGNKLWLIYKVTTSDTTVRYRYYLLCYTGAAGGFHPVFVSDGTTDPAYLPSAVMLYNGKLRYSVGNDLTGYLLTDNSGDIPESDSTHAFNWNVGITTGWLDCERASVTKHFQKLQTSIKDLGTGTTLKPFYKKLGDSAWTALTNTTKGTQDLLEINFPTESGAAAGMTATKINLLLELRNADTPKSAGWLESLHLVNRASYPVARQFTFACLLDTDELEGDNYEFSAQQVYDGLVSAMNQAAPVTLTWVDGTTYNGTVQPVPGGDEIVESNTEDRTWTKRRIRWSFVEDR